MVRQTRGVEHGPLTLKVNWVVLKDVLFKVTFVNLASKIYLDILSVVFVYVELSVLTSLIHVRQKSDNR